MASGKKPLSPLLQHLRPSDLRAAAQLASTATASVARMAEGVNQAVWSTLGAPGAKVAGRTRGITGLVFKSVQGITGLVGQGVDAALAKLQPYIEPADTAARPTTPEREAVLAALNGVMGDHLAASGNALATTMTLRYQGQALDWPSATLSALGASGASGAPSNLPIKAQVSNKVIVMVHGLCMNDLQWRTVHGAGTANAHIVNYGAALADALGATVLYVRYNTGLHTSVNGHELSRQLGQLMLHWPRPIKELTIVVHSMGGLITRSAVSVAQQAATQAAWLKPLKSIVFLGTPHHGAPLEKAGNWVDIILGSTPYSKPFAKLGQLRSAGITDLRYGHISDIDWMGKDRFRRQPDSRQHTPLPHGVACFTVAGTVAAQRSLLAQRLVGDGLVTLASALGQHTDPARSLQFDKASQMIAYRTNHMQLLSSEAVGAQLRKWLSPITP